MFGSLLAAFIVLLPLTLAIAVPPALKRTPSDYTPLSPSPSTVQKELGSCLSKKASLYFPNSPNFHNYTQRWSAAVDPEFAVVVVPAVDEDVSCTVSHTLSLGRQSLLSLSGEIRQQTQRAFPHCESSAWHSIRSIKCLQWHRDIHERYDEHQDRP